jgi:hypothetical protein
VRSFDASADLVEFVIGVAAAIAEYLAAAADELAVVAEVAVVAPATVWIEVVRVSCSPSAHRLITLSRVVR